MTNTEPPAPEARIAGAPISWGVCEVPGWGYQLGPDRVLAEMRQVGLTATELGPDGFLPAGPEAMTRVLDHHGLRAVGGFTPLLLHVAAHDPVPEVERLLQGYDATGAEVLVLSAVTGAAGYDSRPVLDDDGWMVLLINLDRLAELAAQAPERIAHVHFKDVDAHLARRVQDGRLTYTQGVREGMYRPLGSGDVDVSAIVGSLHARGYDGWYVLEQDTILTEEPRGEGPVADVRASADYLRSVLRGTR